MNTANISYARNNFSKLLGRVREGESVLIVDRNRPVARMEPVAGRQTAVPERRLSLVRRGIVRPAAQKLNLKAFLAMPKAKPSGGGDVVKALVSEREEGR